MSAGGADVLRGPAAWVEGTTAEPVNVLARCPACGDSMQVGRGGAVRCDSGCDPARIWAVTAPLVRDPGEDDDDDPLERLRADGLDGAELLALEFPPPVWLVDGIIQAGATTCFFGPPNSGKTFLAIDCIARMMAAGKRALLAEEEGSPRDLQERIRRAFRAREVSREQLAGLHVLHGAELDLTNAIHTGKIEALARDLRPDLIVLDSLSAMAGGADENSPEFALLANTLNTIAARTGAAVLVLHHATKEAWKEGMKPGLHTLRGHGSLPGRLDVAIAVSPVPEATTVDVLAFDIFEVKRRDGAKAGPRRVTIAMPSSGPAATCDIYEIDREAEQADAAKQKQAEALEAAKVRTLDALRGAGDRGLLTTELREDVGGRTEVADEARRVLLAQGRIVRRKPMKGEKAGRLVLVGAGPEAAKDDA